MISRKAWLQEHRQDVYVRRARDQEYRSRSAFKLLEIQKQDRLLQPGQLVLDLGAAPGGWSQVAAKLVQPSGIVVAVDILKMDPIAGVDFLHGDMALPEVADALRGLIKRPADLILSDMAPNLSGIADRDTAAVAMLFELALEVCRCHLARGGHLLLKTFHTPEFVQLKNGMASHFAQLIQRKPASSRSRSAELYLLGRNYRGRP